VTAGQQGQLFLDWPALTAARNSENIETIAERLKRHKLMQPKLTKLSNFRYR